ncbi:MAG TPA: hypothetical protein DCS93_43010 [Microscillaceae bacterium]|nr:hypothetical protein [Microscillaceae bacterium]
MKKITYILLISLLSSSLVLAQKRAKTPVDLLKKIHKYASKKEYDKLKPYLYQGVITNGPTKEMTGKTMAEIILKGMKEGNMGSDFSFNADALQTIIDKHSDRLEPIPQKLRSKLFGESRSSFSQFKDLKQIADNTPNDLYTFEYKGVRMLIAKINKGFRLVFWEGLKYFGKNGNNLSTEPSKGGGK